MLPKYEQIKQELLQEIKSHKFIPDDKFYSEADIKRMYSVSSITAVKALNELTSAGYLYRIQGKGTFVSKAKVSQNVKFSDIGLHSLDQEKVQVSSVEEDDNTEILKELDLPTDASYYRIKRVHFFGDIPYLVQFTHLPKKMMKEPIAKNLNDYANVYERIHKDFALDLFSFASVETHEIVFLDEAELLSLLQLNLKEPAIKQIKHSYLADNSVAEYSISYKHWKYFKTKIEVAPE